MIKVAMLLAFVLMFYTGCGKKVVKEEMSSETEGISTSTAPSTEETATPSATTESTAAQGTVGATTPSSQETITPTKVAPVEVAIPESKVMTDKPTPKDVQTALKNAGFYEGKIDGTLGPKTKKAIENFQTQNNLKADGKVGAKTWNKLKPFLSQSKGSLATPATR